MQASDVFICGHAYHSTCLRGRRTCYQCTSQQIVFDGDEVLVEEESIKEAVIDRKDNFIRKRQVLRALDAMD